MALTSFRKTLDAQSRDIWTMTHFLVALLVLLVSGPEAASGTSNIYASGCTGQELRLSCPQYHRIAIKRVFYGVKRNWDCNVDLRARGNGDTDVRSRYTFNGSSSADCCRATHLDCQVDNDAVYPTLNTLCSGFPECELQVQKVQTRSPCRYKSYTDYMTIVYDCIPEGDIAMFCSDDVKRGKNIYLANKEYPSAIRPGADGAECKCLVRTSSPQGISLHTIDLLLAWGERGPMECRRSMTISDPMNYQRHIQCAHRGFYGFKSIYSRPVSNVTVTLSSLPGDGMAFVWLQAKPNEANGLVEIFCGQSLQDLLDRIRHQFESRHREETKKQADDDDISKIEDEEENNNNTSTLPAAHSTQTLNSDLAAIVGGIVVAGFILIAAVIIALALHCRRMRREKLAAKPLEMYPAVNSEPLDLASYCRYDYDDDHLCSINRSPKKMAALADEEDREHRRHLQGHSDDDSDPAAAHLRPNGFVTVATTEDYHLHRDPTPSPPFPAGLSTPPPSAQNQPLLSAGGKTYREVHYPGDLSLRFVKPIVKEDPNQGDGGQNTNTMNTNGVYSYNYNPYPPPPPPVGFEHQGHTTLPANRKAVLINTGPKSPLGKRSKSVTFSQPVAMVTPLNSESEESMESGSLKQQQPPLKQQHYDDEEEPNYDNLNQLDIPDSPVMPGKPELIKIPRWDKEYREESPMRPLSTFQNSPSPPPHEVKVIIAPPPTDLNLQPQLDDHKSGSAPPFWSPTKQTGKPMVMPKPQKAHLYETGV